MTKDEILKKHEDDNEYHFHQVDREWIMEAMQEYADLQIRLYGVVVPKGTLCDCEKPNRYYCLKTGGDRCRKCKKLL